MQLIQKKEKLKMWIVALTALLILLFIGGCSLRGQVLDGDGMVNSYKQISQEEAAQMMEEDDVVILDVRTVEEYNEGHIPGAICIPNEDIRGEKPEELPDVDQVLLIYCRTGRRSKEAADKLFNLGYNNVYEFGGIVDWTGEIVTEE